MYRRSAEQLSGECYLPAAQYPKLRYEVSGDSQRTHITLDGSNLKVLYLKKSEQLLIYSSIAAKYTVKRLDNNALLLDTTGSDDFITDIGDEWVPDFKGSLPLEVCAFTENGDVTVDYLTLRLDDTAPLITVDEIEVYADADGSFTISGKLLTGANSYEDDTGGAYIKLEAHDEAKNTGTAYFSVKLAQDKKYTVNVDGNFADVSGAGEYNDGVDATVFAGERAGYFFGGWTATGVTPAGLNADVLSFTMPVNDVSLTAKWIFADFNSDGHINVLDLITLQKNLGTSDMSFDLNLDGEVNAPDITEFCRLFLRK